IPIIDKSDLVSGNNNVLLKVVVYPARGVVYDRDDEVLVQNEPVYALLVTPIEAEDIRTALLCQLLDIDSEGWHTMMHKARAHAACRPSIFEKQLSASTLAPLQEHLYKFRGFYVQNRTVRS